MPEIIKIDEPPRAPKSFERVTLAMSERAATCPDETIPLWLVSSMLSDAYDAGHAAGLVARSFVVPVITQESTGKKKRVLSAQARQIIRDGWKRRRAAKASAGQQSERTGNASAEGGPTVPGGTFQRP